MAEMDRGELGELLLLAITRMHRLQLSNLEQPGVALTLRQYRILQRINDGHTSLSALANVAWRSLPSVSESVDHLIRRKLVTRTVSPRDRRAAQLSLTPAGHDALAAGSAALRELSDQFLATVPKSQLRAMQNLAQRMYDFAGDEMSARNKPR